MHRSYLFAPGHDARLVDRVFTAGADAVMLDLEDPVPPGAKARARRMVADALGERPAWVRVNALRSEFAEDVQWIVDRCGGNTPPLICAVESARGLLALAAGRDRAAAA